VDAIHHRGSPFDIEREWFQGKVAVVTGARIGIGRGIAEMLLDAGVSVVVTGRDGAAMREAARRLTAQGGSVLGIGADVTDQADVQRTVGQTLDHFGRLDFLVNSAGTRQFSPLHETSLAEWDEVMEVQLTGTFLSCQAAIDPLLESGGRIVNMGSIYGYLGRDTGASYAASKTAVVALTKVLASELAPRVNVNAIAPGTIETERRYPPEMAEGEKAADRQRRAEPVPLRRVGTPEDVAWCTLFLLGPGASWMTGQVMHPNGGFVMP
jgi:3-oxoacyl-[acyl-carrier protein] reductase